MPSGSHGGSSGSHSGGGSSSGGSGSGGSGGIFSSRPQGPRSFRWRNRIYVLSEKQSSQLSSLKFGIIISIFFMLCSSFVLIGINQSLKKIKVDYYYYQDMITYAESHPEYLRTGYVTDHFYNENCEKWYFTYKIEQDDHPGYWLEGYTYSCYTREEIKNFKINSSIEIAVNSSYVTSKTDSIPLDYKNMPLTKDGEYAQYLKIKHISIGVLVVTGVLCIVFIGLEIHIVTKAKQLSSSTSSTNKSTEQANLTKNSRKCAYCGQVVNNKYIEKCPYCGAKLE